MGQQMNTNCSLAILLDISQNTKYFVQKLTDSFNVFFLFILMHYLSAIEGISKTKGKKKHRQTKAIKNHVFYRPSSWRQELMTFDTVKIYALQYNIQLRRTILLLKIDDSFYNSIFLDLFSAKCCKRQHLWEVL